LGHVVNMSPKVIASVTLIIVSFLAGYLVVCKPRLGRGLTTTLRISVTPREQLNFVAAQANSSLFKFVIGREAGLAPGLMRKLEVKPDSDSSVIDAKVAVRTRDEGQRFSKAFVAALQSLCGNQAQLSLASQAVQ